jgi:hypothetical protein
MRRLRFTGQRITIQDHHVMMILIYATTVATGRDIGSTCNRKCSSLPAPRPMVGTAITRKRLAATSSSCLALLVI